MKIRRPQILFLKWLEQQYLLQIEMTSLTEAPYFVQRNIPVMEWALFVCKIPNRILVYMFLLPIVK